MLQGKRLSNPPDVSWKRTLHESQSQMIEDGETGDWAGGMAEQGSKLEVAGAKGVGQGLFTYLNIYIHTCVSRSSLDLKSS